MQLKLENTIILTAVLLSTVPSFAQTVPFDNLNANYGVNKSILWYSSNYGAGYGHRIINADPGGKTLLNFQGRNGSATWSDIMTLTSKGNVGIGTTDPTQKLYVVGNSVVDAGNGSSLKINGYHGLETTGNPHWLHLNRYSNDHVAIGYNSTANTLLGYGGGKVGIGTASPTEKLHVNGAVRIARANNQDNNSPSFTCNSDDDFTFNNQYLSHYGLGFHSGLNENKLNSYVSGFWGINLFTRGKLQVRVDSNGNMGVGTDTTSGYRLSVNGNVRATEVKVYTEWADYVFKDDYKLPSLEEVAQHIQEKGHLPNIPSANEVSEEGIYLGEMNAKLLEKIEELTLYTIAQEEQLKKQEKRIQELEQINKIPQTADTRPQTPDTLTALQAKNQELEARLARIEALLTKEKE